MKKLFLAMAIAIVTATAVSAQEDKMVISTVQTKTTDMKEIPLPVVASNSISNFQE